MEDTEATPQYTDFDIQSVTSCWCQGMATASSHERQWKRCHGLPCTDGSVRLKFHEEIAQEGVLSDNQVFGLENNILFLLHSNVASVKG